MDPLRFREPYLRRPVQSHQQQAMASLSSGQSYYTVESLEAATSLPFLKSAPHLPPHLAPQDAVMHANRDMLLAAERETLLRELRSETADPRSRLLAAAEREALFRNLPSETSDSRPRLLAPERDALLRNMHGDTGDLRARLLAAERDPFLRNLPGEARARHIPEAETRVMGLSDRRIHPDGDIRGVGFDVRHPHMHAGIYDDRLRDPLVSDAFTLRAQERVPPPELRGGVKTGLRPVDPMVSASHFHANGSRVTKVPRSAIHEIPKPAERSNQQPARSSAFAQSHASKSKAPLNKVKQLLEQSEGWCAVCNVNCLSVKNLQSHLAGKKHKEKLQEGGGGGDKTIEPAVNVTKEKLQGGEGKTSEPVEPVTKEESSKVLPSEEDASQADGQKRAIDGKVSSEASASKAEKKRANNGEPEGTQSSVKRPKKLNVTIGTNSATTDALTIQMAAPKAKADKPVATSSGPPKVTLNPSHPVCKICNIFTTSEKNLETHLKGKRHAARVQELKEEGKAV